MAVKVIVLSVAISLVFIIFSNITCSHHGLGSRSADGLLHEPGDDADDLLHEADVVQQGYQAAEVDDYREDLEGEEVVGERLAEEELDADVNFVDEGLDHVAHHLEALEGRFEAEDEEGKEELNQAAPDDRSPFHLRHTPGNIIPIKRIFTVTFSTHLDCQINFNI